MHHGCNALTEERAPLPDRLDCPGVVADMIEQFAETLIWSNFEHLRALDGKNDKKTAFRAVFGFVYMSKCQAGENCHSYPNHTT